MGLLQPHVRRGGGDGEGDALIARATPPGAAASLRHRIAPYAAGVKELILSIQRGEFGFPITWDDQPDLHDIPVYYRKGAGEFWLAKDEAGRIVGSIGLLDLGDGQGALRKMFVAKEWRGGAHGVAQRLLDTLLTRAREGGLRIVFLGTTEAFRAAHRFYEKSGFRKADESALPANFPRMAGDTRFYRLDLA